MLPPQLPAANLNTGVFDKDGIKISTIPDGSSNTVLLAEGYAICTSSTTTGASGSDQTTTGGYRYGYYNQIVNSVYTYNITYTYAAGYTVSQTLSYSQYIPRFSLLKGKTFQVRPIPSQCDASVPQGFAGSLLVLLGDGSVKGVSSGVSESTWAGALTPDGGELLNGDW
jgi:hypothetical protein